MRTENVFAVAKALTKKPMTIKALTGRTGLSYATVKRALEDIKAVRVEGSWPIEWTKPLVEPEYGISLADISTLTPSIASAEGTAVVLVDLVQGDDLLARWQDRQEAFAAELKNLVVRPDTDPAKLSAALANGASALASLAYAIREQETKPEWFTILGGQLDRFDHDKLVS